MPYKVGEEYPAPKWVGHRYSHATYNADAQNQSSDSPSKRVRCATYNRLMVICVLPIAAEHNTFEREALLNYAMSLSRFRHRECERVLGVRLPSRFA